MAAKEIRKRQVHRPVRHDSVIAKPKLPANPLDLRAVRLHASLVTLAFQVRVDIKIPPALNVVK
jgi:hypothetical protein